MRIRNVSVTDGKKIKRNRVLPTITLMADCYGNAYYGCDVGADMAATYHRVISTVKLHGSSAWDFIGTFFKNIFNGCRDYVNMVPGKIAVATSQG